MLSVRLSPGTRPVPSRSSGTNERPARRAALGPLPVTSLPPIVTRPLLGRDHAGEGAGEWALTVAGHAGDADDLAAVDLEVDVVDQRLVAVVRP